jgi:hypothetical protein
MPKCQILKSRDALCSKFPAHTQPITPLQTHPIPHQSQCPMADLPRFLALPHLKVPDLFLGFTGETVRFQAASCHQSQYLTAKEELLAF